jgi:hypothetical protein
VIKYIRFKKKLLAIIIQSKYQSQGIEFFTPDNFSQQLGYMRRDKKYVIKPHLHNSVKREVSFTKEVLFIKSGKVRVDFYNEKKIYFESRVLNKGDVILLAFGGHGFYMMEPSEIIEVKQGPYSGKRDKFIFDPVSNDKIKIVND